MGLERHVHLMLTSIVWLCLLLIYNINLLKLIGLPATARYLVSVHVLQPASERQHVHAPTI